MRLEECPQDIVMVGDREHDVYGARQWGIDCVAVTYGYGEKEELKSANPHRMVNSVKGLRDFF